MNDRHFSENELIPAGYTSSRYVKDMPVFHTPITARENFLRAIKRQSPYWLPMTTDIKEFSPEICPDNIARHQVRSVCSEKYEELVYKDMFGVEWGYEPEAAGSMVRSGCKLLENISDWKSVIKFPDIGAYDWEGCARRNKGVYFDTGSLTQLWIFNGFFERLMSFMEVEDAMIAMLDEDDREHVMALFDRLSELYTDMVDHFVDYFHMDSLLLHDDWGTQRGPMLSLETCRTVIVPYLKKVADHCHKRGVLFNFHSCGKNEMLVPAMIEAGVDMWEGQTMNDYDMLREKYGESIIFGISAPNAEDDAQAEKIGEELAAKYASVIDTKPAFIGFRGNFNPKMRTSLYIASREICADMC